MRRTALTLVAAVLSGAYWCAFLLFAEVFTAADYRPGSEPSETWLDAKAAFVVLAGPLLFAGCIAGWRRIERALEARRE